jgi:hypothetical protein
MRRVGAHSFTEIYFAGCNPGFVETSPRCPEPIAALATR